MLKPSSIYIYTVLKFTLNYFDSVQNIVILSRNLAKEGRLSPLFLPEWEFFLRGGGGGAP